MQKASGRELNAGAVPGLVRRPPAIVRVGGAFAVLAVVIVLHGCGSREARTDDPGPITHDDPISEGTGTPPMSPADHPPASVPAPGSSPSPSTAPVPPPPVASGSIPEPAETSAATSGPASTLDPTSGPVHDEIVAAVQRRLVEIGLDPGSTDGESGPRTRAAIDEYRRFSGAGVSAEADANLLAALDATLADWRSQGSDESWAVVATRIGPAQGAASGRDRLQAHVEAKRDCLVSSGGGGDCRSVRVLAIGEVEQCVALLVENGSSRKHFGFATADPLKNVGAREAAVNDAVRLCGDSPGCGGETASESGTVYCTSDFRR